MPSTTDTLEQQNEGGQCISLRIGDPESTLVASIQEILNVVPRLSSNICIYRVPEKLRKINEEAYTPQLVSIGPFHHGKENLRAMETHKWQYLHSFIYRKPDIALPEYVKTMKQIEERTRQCYSESVSINSDEFVTMMLVDGCFILEFLLRNLPLELSHREDPLSSTDWLSSAIKCDFILLENQLPFFVLERLYKLNQGDGLHSLIKIIRFSFSRMVPEEEQVLRQNSKCSKVKQMLASVCNCCSSSSSCAMLRENGETDSVSTVEMPDLVFRTFQVKHLLDFLRDCYIPSLPKMSLGNEKELEFPNNVTTLHEAGVKFEVVTGKCLLDISFKEGVLAIPCINIQDWTESLLRNMICFEQLHCVAPRYITDYASLLDSFIDSSKDVILLREHGIIKSLLGDHEQVSLLFNKLVKEVNVDAGDFYFCDICQDLNAYYRVIWHSWKANLRHTYFNTPWTVISVLAAAVLLVLTLLQTIYTIKSSH
ncbi:UPF0481 protein At3g47200-like isoform X2 [Macadamia integrifolia]|uniref:UPF0481 protein At3g47200-like isoform X2 n=1 Tax=Macadamia integrifolia TaxID=60698 RepID=UPI001C4FAE2D|nr:UPF0481 protein At3g47200-like isoform X2 [Macadamia integrifolia]